MDLPPPAPEFDVSQWLNVDHLDLAALRGRIVVIEAFQMLCPACVQHSLPQAVRLHRQYSPDDVAVVGLHTVFEHHDVMGPDALATFLSEFGISFPVGIDRHDDPDDRIPATMREYGFQGTPSLVLLDRLGRVRSSTFGVVEDLALGTAIGRLLAEPAPAAEPVG